MKPWIHQTKYQWRSRYSVTRFYGFGSVSISHFRHNLQIFSPANSRWAWHSPFCSTFAFQPNAPFVSAAFAKQIGFCFDRQKRKPPHVIIWFGHMIIILCVWSAYWFILGRNGEPQKVSVIHYGASREQLITTAKRSDRVGSRLSKYHLSFCEFRCKVKLNGTVLKVF